MSVNHVKTFGQFVNESTKISRINENLYRSKSVTLSVQKKLSVPTTGKTDTATINAIKGYQEGHGLKVTGQLDVETCQSLGISLKNEGQYVYDVNGMPKSSSSGTAIR